MDPVVHGACTAPVFRHFKFVLIFEFGFPQMGVFVRLKASARNSILVDSVIGKLRKIEKSKSFRESPRNTFRPKSPNVPVAGSANAEMLNQQLRDPIPAPIGHAPL